MSGPAHSWTATIPLAAAASRAASRASAALLGCQPVAGGRAHQVVGVAGQRPLRRRSPRRPPGLASAGAARSTPPPSGRRRGPGRRAGRRPRRPGRRCSAASLSGQPDSSQPCPQIGPSGCARAYSATSSRQCRSEVAVRRSRPASIRPVAVRWTWLSTKAGATKAAVEIDDLRVGKLLAPDVIAAEPHDGAIADGHRGGVRHGGTVHPAVEEEGRHLVGLGRQGLWFDVDDVDDFAVDVVAASPALYPQPGAAACAGGA